MTRLFFAVAALCVFCLALAFMPMSAQPPQGKAASQAKPGDAAKEIQELERKNRNLKSELRQLHRDYEAAQDEIKQLKDELDIRKRVAAAIWPSTPHQNTLAIIRILGMPMATEGFQDPKKLKDVCEVIMDPTMGKMPFILDKRVFAGVLPADSPEPYEMEVVIPVPGRMEIAAILNAILAQIGKNEATYVIRPGLIEITTVKASKATAALEREQVTSEFRRAPLATALRDLSDQSAVSINLDPNLGERAKAPITARFRDASLREALTTLTVMGQLKFVVLDRSIFVTTPERVKVLEQEEAIRAKMRPARLAAPSVLALHPLVTIYGQGRPAITQTLQARISTAGFQEKRKLKDVLEALFQRSETKAPVMINRAAITGGNPDSPDPEEKEVSLPQYPKQMSLETALRLFLAQIGGGKATYVTRRNWIEITSIEAANIETRLYPARIVAAFENRALSDVLDSIGAQAEVAINLDANVGLRDTLLINAVFRNCSLEDALVAVTEMAGLKYVVMDRSIFVTTPEQAAALAKEEKQRAERRAAARTKAAPAP